MDKKLSWVQGTAILLLAAVGLAIIIDVFAGK